MQAMKPAEYKHLLVSLKTKKLKRLEESNKKNKRTRRRNKKTKTWIGKSNNPIKTECKLSKHFAKLQKYEKYAIKNKTDKNWKKTWNNVLF